ncbi:MAG: dihydrodipicolinate synthase family protein [Ferroplasma sp.]|uniref:dihydrodipicolinate synthase family protein n=1 Tax=Ferroplasma sp. TaxID=2591003 RepID=UPI002814C3FB|nr:dihydrodipicolinate synthase family protein [Ferroplasma sp.]WMT51144.1 MAG: dihydrodipicolinate synthase family protein [Ferroplasma sp.]
MNHGTGFKINSAIPTVFNINQEINWDETSGIVEFLNRINVKNISILLFGGEHYRLSLEEKKNQIELITGIAGSRQKVFVGLNDVSFNSTMILEKEADKYGAVAGIISIPPYMPFYGVRKNTVKRFLSMVLKSSGIPLILQDTGVPESILPEPGFWRKYINNGKLAGFKIEGMGSMRKIKTLHAMYMDTEIYGGYLGINMEKEIKSGSAGSIIGSSMPDKIRETILNNASSTIKEDVLKMLRFEVNHLYSFTSIEKYILMKRGIISGYTCRCPCPPFSHAVLGRSDTFYNKIFGDL